MEESKRKVRWVSPHSAVCYNKDDRGPVSPWMGCKSIAGLPPALSLLVPIYTPGHRGHCESEVSCPKAQQNDPSQGLNLEMNTLTMRPPRLPI